MNLIPLKLRQVMWLEQSIITVATVLFIRWIDWIEFMIVIIIDICNLYTGILILAKPISPTFENIFTNPANSTQAIIIYTSDYENYLFTDVNTCSITIKTLELNNPSVNEVSYAWNLYEIDL